MILWDRSSKEGLCAHTQILLLGSTSATRNLESHKNVKGGKRGLCHQHQKVSLEIVGFWYDKKQRLNHEK